MTVAVNSTGQAESVEGFARMRATRQQRLTSEDPLILRAVITEAVLRREVGGPDVIRDQARWLVEVATLPDVTVQVLPFSAGAHPGMTGPFTMLRFAERSMNVVFIDCAVARSTRSDSLTARSARTTRPHCSTRSKEGAVSSDQGGNCGEVADLPDGGRGVWDSKDPPGSS